MALNSDDPSKLGVVRYFDDPAEVAELKAAKATRTVCKNCGAEGEHKTWECPVIIVSTFQLLQPEFHLHLLGNNHSVSRVVPVMSIPREVVLSARHVLLVA